MPVPLTGDLLCGGIPLTVEWPVPTAGLYYRWKRIRESVGLAIYSYLFSLLIFYLAQSEYYAAFAHIKGGAAHYVILGMRVSLGKVAALYSRRASPAKAQFILCQERCPKIAVLFEYGCFT